MTLAFITPELSYRLEQCHAWRSVNYAAAYQRLHPEAQTAVLHVGGGTCVFVSPSLPLNNACALGLTGPVQPEELEAVEDFYLSRGVPPRLHASPLCDHAFFDLLCQRGYRLTGFFSALARPIPPDFSPAPLPDGLTIRRARPEEAEQWIRLTGQGFEGAETISPEAVEILGPNFHAEEAAPYIAFMEGQPAGGGGMYYHDGVVELGGASTRPAFRRRGVQRALIEARLAHARDVGCDLALVLTEPGSDSQRNVERAGFALAYTRVVLTKQ